MPLQTSNIRVAGQESDIVDILFPSDASQSLLDAGFSAKQMYGRSESIKSWIDAIGRPDKSAFGLDDYDDADVLEFAAHRFRVRGPRSPSTDEFESGMDVSCPFSASAWAPVTFASSYDDDSDESRSESSFSPNAQYISIPSDSPWYRLPSPSPGPIWAHDFTGNTAAYVNSCSSDVRQAIAQQELLLTIFHEELRRVVPCDGGAEYDSDWLEDVDVDLLLAPLETYTDLCWESTVCEKSITSRLDRPIPDVPIGFDEAHGPY